MRILTALALTSALLLPAAPRSLAQEVEAIDAVLAAPDQFSLLRENDHVRVLEYTLEPGESDAWHTHPAKLSYVVSGGTLEVTLQDGESFTVEEETGGAEWSERRGKHRVENIGDTPVRIVLVEVKGADPTARGASRPLIAIDPGHGGSELGVQADGVEEKDVVLGLAFVLAGEYNLRGYDVLFTRTGDHEVGWDERRALAERAGAALLVSLHFRGGDDLSAHGITIFANVADPSVAAAANAMAESLRGTGWPVVVESRDFGFLLSPDVPTLMVEGGYLVNPSDRATILTPEFQETLATRIVDGTDGVVAGSK